ncbi:MULTISPECIES: hypothetical protein [Burkholderia cepacia complex]|uniref:Uncharacterized protein n=1 Tax=Burkholderia vietnamiensis TaxID=60552 RepID=A0AAW7T6B4_BURVI|nr:MULTISPECIES: hypothetical protein [Burkholderia cepacia complex]MBU9639565.1 hypothetical protein [Burkholderia multivorans]MDN7798321.1 hypothetical protein [Burkholderia vietnamiensis]
MMNYNIKTFRENLPDDHDYHYAFMCGCKDCFDDALLNLKHRFGFDIQEACRASLTEVVKSQGQGQ